MSMHDLRSLPERLSRLPGAATPVTSPPPPRTYVLA